MRIGIVTTSYPRFAGDPSGHFVQSHAHALVAQGNDVHVICANVNVNVNVNADTAVIVHRVASSSHLFFSGGAPDALERATPRSLLAAAAFSARLTAAIASRAHRFDAIIAHWLAPSALAAALASRAPLLAIAHGGDIHTLRRLHLLRPALHALHARGAELAFVSAELLATARDAVPPSLLAYLDRARVQPMGLDLARFAALAAARAPTTPPTIAVLARLTPIKGVDVALAALAHLRTPVQLVIAGDGPERAALEAAARAHPNARFVGELTTPQRDELLARASVVVVPSRELANARSEGSPLIALEALAAGIPVVASATGGLRALAPAAILVPPEHPPLLAHAIDHALLAPPAAATLRATVAHLDWSRVASVLAPTQLRA